MACAERSERREPKACCEASEGRLQAVLIGVSVVVSDLRDWKSRTMVPNCWQTTSLRVLQVILVQEVKL